MCKEVLGFPGHCVAKHDTSFHYTKLHFITTSLNIVYRWIGNLGKCITATAKPDTKALQPHLQGFITTTLNTQYYTKQSLAHGPCLAYTRNRGKTSVGREKLSEDLKLVIYMMCALYTCLGVLDSDLGPQTQCLRRSPTVILSPPAKNVSPCITHI